jgi:hypothetical protein
MAGLDSLVNKWEGLERELYAEQRRALTSLGKSWGRLVRNTVLTGRRASPTGLVITHLISSREIEIGWWAYRDDASSERRFELRRHFLEKAVLRAQKKFKVVIERGLTS